MSAVTFTPGPWGWRWKSGSLHQMAPDGRFGPTVLTPTYSYDEGIGVVVSDADHALIEAAPDLYAALTQAIGPLEYAYRNVSSVTADKVKQKILPAMRAALARARGETP